MISIRIPAPPAEMPRFIRDHLSQAYRVIEQSFGTAVRRGQDYEVGEARIWLTSPNGSRYYITVFDDGTISTDGNPTPPAGTVTSVAATAPAAGFTISGSPITGSGTFVFALADDLAAVEALSGSGIAVRTGTSTWALLDLKGYIEGLQMSWGSATGYTVSTGAAYVESLDRIYEVGSAITRSSLSLSANTWYHVYLYDNSGTPAIEESTTAPTLYSGTARSKTGDSSRRYVGSLLTDGSGNLYKFRHDPATGHVRHLTNINTFQVLSNGTSTVDATVDGSGAVPVTSRLAECFIEMDASGGLGVVSNADVGTPALSNILAFARAGQQVSTLLALDANQDFTYQTLSPSVGFNVWLPGYFYER